STNVAKDQIMSVNENLKLRSGEATSTDVLTVMSVGTKVKILELGKAETIDGIYSNWVKVEVQKGAKDRDGKPIKSGSVGWCYGGYLK
ncbi:MAG: SH3 domain-containing protein, partial [Treponema sp.]|nr:SH3 domain-containing protein [Treponema sp.]